MQFMNKILVVLGELIFLKYQNSNSQNKTFLFLNQIQKRIKRKILWIYIRVWANGFKIALKLPFLRALSENWKKKRFFFPFPTKYHFPTPMLKCVEKISTHSTS